MNKLTRFATIILLLSVLLTACGQQERVLSSDEQAPILEFAEPLSNDLFSALESGNYDDFIKNMDEAMVKSMTEKSYNDLREMLKTKTGAYLSRTVKSITEVGEYYAVIYAAVYENAPEVTVRIVFTKSEPHLISGLWLNSPELSK